MAKYTYIDENGDKAIIKFITDNCRVCNEVDRELYENCEQCYFLKTFLTKRRSKLK